MGLVVEHGRRACDDLADQVVAHDDDGEAGRADVLLRAGVDHAEFRHVDRARQDGRRHVGHQRHAAGVGGPENLHAADGLVGRVVHVGGVGIELPLILCRRVAEVLVFARRHHVHRAVALGFLDRLLRPLAGVEVIGAGFAAQQVHRHHGELRRRAALQEQHLVVGGDAHQLAQIGLGLGGDAHEFLAAMAHFHHRHAAAVPVDHLGLHLLQHFLG